MKKFLTLLLFTSLLASGIVYAGEVQSPPPPPSSKIGHEKIKNDFEKRLNLTDKQKEKAKAIHKKGFEQIKPVMEKTHAKFKELNEVKNSTTLSPKEKELKAAQIQEELKVLKQKSDNIRKENSKEFEKILTKKQKEELEKMKMEGRKRYKQNHPQRPPYNYFKFPDKKPLFNDSLKD